MPIVSISLTDEILKDLQQLKSSMGFSGKSDAIRACIRSFVAEEKQKIKKSLKKMEINKKKVAGNIEKKEAKKKPLTTKKK